MNIAGIQWPVFNPYHKPTVEIYISGVTKNAKDAITQNFKTMSLVNL